MSILTLLVAIALIQTPQNSDSAKAGQQHDSHRQGDPPVTVNPTPDDDNPNESLPSKWLGRLNLPFKTAGGTQLWTDHVWRQGYRVQQNSITGHWRLVDAGDVRRAWGTREHCQATLDEQVPKGELDDEPGQVIVLLHGLLRTHRSMKPLEQALRDAGHDHVVRFAYASTRASIQDHAAALEDVLNDFPANTEFTFAGHSMGNIVVRYLINDLQQDDPAQLLPRFHCMVMLGPPNQGAAIARRLATTGVFEYVAGKGAMELGPQWNAFVEKLATPSFPFVIIAGDVSEGKVLNPLVDGTGDFIVSVDEAKLDGAESFHRLHVLHSFLMSDQQAIDLTLEFLAAHPVAE